MEVSVEEDKLPSASVETSIYFHDFHQLPRKISIEEVKLFSWKLVEASIEVDGKLKLVEASMEVDGNFHGSTLKKQIAWQLCVIRRDLS